MKELSLVVMVMLAGMATVAVAQDHQMIDPIAESHQNEATKNDTPPTPKDGISSPLRISAVQG